MTNENRQCGDTEYAVMPRARSYDLISGVVSGESGSPVFADMYLDGKRPTYGQSTGRGNQGVLSTPLYIPAERGGDIPNEPTHYVGRVRYDDDIERKTIALQHHGLPAHVLEDMDAAGLASEEGRDGPASAAVTHRQAQWLVATYPAETSV